MKAITTINQGTQALFVFIYPDNSSKLKQPEHLNSPVILSKDKFSALDFLKYSAIMQGEIQND
jgi:hypothetical protein